MEDFKKRLLEYIEGHLGLSIRSFEERCGLTHGTIAGIKVKGPSVDNVAKISSAFPDLNLNWLIMGKGSMLIQEQPVASHQNDIHHNQQVVIANWSDLKNVLTEAIKGASEVNHSSKNSSKTDENII